MTNLEKLLKEFADSFLEDSANNKKFHVTVGVYPNGDFKINRGVLHEDLYNHILYQDARPGRAFIVDGKIVHKGQCTMPTILEALNLLGDKAFIPVQHCTKLYV